MGGELAYRLKIGVIEEEGPASARRSPVDYSYAGKRPGTDRAD
jgi:hypothetical protein